MSDPDGDTVPRMSRRELRQLREALPDAPPQPQSPGLFPPAQPSIPTPAAHPAAATILTVCTGNICRSPMAEALLRARLRDLGVRVHSAGTHALVGHAMTEQALALATRFGAAETDARGHAARLLTEAILTESDLVLAMTREHRSYIVQLAPSLLRRAFTVREFARLAATLSDAQIRSAADATGSAAGDRLRALAALVGGQRGLVLAQADEDDVIDPYRRSQETYELSASQLGPAIDQVERAVRAALE
ncbi:arsenate reductase/protein-tyrosine-phosphatase family protein [Microbacterium sp.]|uniref:arsenate reductase/protein-tyrosine-phosphatase family protein n=1 Tax=Microbacterium sp. TaxID=51671 RepID=UPI002811F3BF|nr:low molecular weight phosphatase family protein [Microbacterium sp.]